MQFLVNILPLGSGSRNQNLADPLDLDPDPKQCTQVTSRFIGLNNRSKQFLGLYNAQEASKFMK